MTEPFDVAFKNNLAFLTRVFPTAEGSVREKCFREKCFREKCFREKSSRKYQQKYPYYFFSLEIPEKY